MQVRIDPDLQRPVKLAAVNSNLSVPKVVNSILRDFKFNKRSLPVGGDRKPKTKV